MKGQSAMEYLMTYGWALLVIVIVIAVLMWINPFKAPEQCIFDQPGFVCSRPVLQQSSSILFADIVNGNQKAINVTHIACVKGRTAPDGNSSNWNSGTSTGTSGLVVEYQGNFNLGQFNASGLTKSVICSDGVLGTSTKVPLTQNQDFNGRIYIAYKFLDDASFVPDKIVGANLVTKAQ